ncbi:conserved protein of unknown function [Modestobacter italicus]|uniref:Uncharacterized protein n=1 Tax=Modestobacter italicus (strain DSM 44449 / CECT 9708 / BC 501) TaxID=2732864 RepID=I4EU97_MODI5|nr:hypothetical protein [Modestobacter marinus]CCH86960.1 conserved protein of unknown function [Modestobacter marinus]
MDILTEDQHRALAFIKACNGQGYGPSADEVETWLREPAIPPGLYNYVGLSVSAAMYGFSRGLVTDQLLRLRWVTGYSGELFTQPLGTALLRDADAKTADVAGATTVVLDAKNPLAYAALMSELAAAGAGLLIDPYIRREQLLHVAEDTTLQRLLISDKISQKDMAGIRALLGYLQPAERHLEVRVTGDAHDRYLKAENDDVYIIGSSMGTVASRKSTTVLTPFPGDSREVVGRMLEARWDAGDPVRAERLQPEPDLPA